MRKNELELAKKLGKELQQVMLKKELDSKMNSLRYKLSNALRVGNADRFLDILLNMYMYLKKEVPEELLTVKFSSYNLKDFGYAFLIGLSLADKKNTENNLMDGEYNEK